LCGPFPLWHFEASFPRLDGGLRRFFFPSYFLSNFYRRVPILLSTSLPSDDQVVRSRSMTSLPRYSPNPPSSLNTLHLLYGVRVLFAPHLPNPGAFTRPPRSGLRFSTQISPFLGGGLFFHFKVRRSPLFPSLPGRRFPIFLRFSPVVFQGCPWYD